ncbi:MAG: ATP-binding protein [Myxococcales bacterium]|nr:ATP-binding protein [Myxococcales bacterium]
MLIVVFGLPGSGKSYFASRLAARLGAAYLSSDALRRELAHKPGYSSAEKARVYEQLLAEASTYLRAERSVVLDATFHRAARRQAVTELATATGAELRWIEIVAPEPTLRERLAKARPDSDADYAVYEKLKQEFEPLAEPHLRLTSTDHNLADMLDKGLKHIET